MTTAPHARLLGRIARGLGLVVTWTAAIAAALVLLAWLTGRVVSDRYAWSQWLLWMPSVAALAAAALGLVAALRPARTASRRRRRILVWGTVALLVALHAAAVEHRMWRRPSSDPGGVRLVHWTVMERLTNERAPLAGALAALAGDVTILTNAGRGSSDAAILEMLDAGPRAHRLGPFTVLTGRPVTELRWVARTKTASLVYLELAPGPRFAAPLRILLVDLPSDPSTPRMAVARETAALLETADPPSFDVVVGDLNMTRGSAALRTLFPGFSHAFDEAGCGWGATFPRDRPLYHIDHVLVGDRVRALQYTVEPTPLGRHRAQVAHLAPR